MAKEEKPAEGAEVKTEAPAPNPKKKKIILFGGIGAGVVVILAVVFLVFGGKKKELAAKAGEETGEEHAEAAEGGDAEKPAEDKKDEHAKDDHGKDAKKDESKEEAKDGEKKEEGETKVERKKKDTASHIGEIYAIPKLDLNLGNPIENRFLRIAIGLEYRGGESQAEELKKRQAQFHDIIITTVSSKTRVDLITETGKNRLRRELLNKFNEICEQPIAALYFTEFVVE